MYFRVHPRPPFFTFGDAPNHLLALVLSPYRGLLWFCPALLRLFGLRNVPKRSIEGWLWKATLGAWIFTWLFIASFSSWSAGTPGAPLPGCVDRPPRTGLRLNVCDGPALVGGDRYFHFGTILFHPVALLRRRFRVRHSESRHPDTCTPWVCSCSALCLRGPWALRAIGNTISSRALPVIELTTSAQAPGGISPLQTSDFNSVYWWPVRVAYRTRKFSPALAFAICMLVLGAACGALCFFYRRLPESSRNAGS